MTAPLRTLPDSTRCVRVRDLEHHCRCWVNAYVQELEEKRTGGSNHASYGELRARHWRTLCELMYGILKQEGMVIDIEEEVDEKIDGET